MSLAVTSLAFTHGAQHILVRPILRGSGMVKGIGVQVDTVEIKSYHV